jgi:hypothetical protein
MGDAASRLRGHRVTQATVLARPALVASCIGSLPCARFIGANANELKTAGNFAQTQPFTISTSLFMPTAASGLTVTDNSFNVQPIDFTSGTNVRVYAGSSAAETYNTSHNFQAIVAGASSFLVADVTNNSISPGVNGFGSAAAGPLNIGNGSLAGATVDLFEIAGWGIAFSTTAVTGQSVLICHNQFVYWGTATSC